MPNPFDAGDIKFFVLINEERQHSLWPEFADTPTGWERIFGPDEKAKCLLYVEEHWRDMRPFSLIREMNSDEKK